MIIARTALALLFAGVSLAALGQETATRAACRPDTQKFCSQVAGADGDKLTDCLVDHQKEISDACYSALKTSLTQQHAQAQSQPPAGPGSCRADVTQFCKGAAASEGVKSCLIDHQKEISDGCYSFLSKQLAGGGQAPQPAHTVYRAQLADGRIVYSDAPISDAVDQREVKMLTGNTALPPHASR